MISVIVVHFGKTETTFKCIYSIIKKINVKYEILIWDNGPDFDFNKKVIDSAIDLMNINLRVLTVRKNIGYGKAINKAVKFCKYEWIMILNNNVEFLKFEVENFQRVLNAIVGAKTYNEDGIVNSVYLDLNPVDELLKNMRIYPILYRLVGWYGNIAVNIFDKEHWTYNIGGHYIFISKKAFLEIGGFDENYFMYAEEFDLCKRARLKGYKIIFSPQIIVFHSKVKASVDERGNNTAKLDIEKVRIESKLYYLRKFYPTLFFFTLFSNFLISFGFWVVFKVIRRMYRLLNGKSKILELERYYYIYLNKVYDLLLS